MLVECRSVKDAYRFINSFAKFVERSRFKVGVRHDDKRRRRSLDDHELREICPISLHPVRLKESKHYCGNHAGPCRIGGGDHHQKLNFLEGADWVAFNHMVNDCLDRLNMTADVQSSIVIVRKGAFRRMDYYSSRNNGEFDRDTDYYADFRLKKSPEPEYTPGTPGIDTWRQKRKKMLAV